MLFFLSFIFIFFGTFLAGLVGLMPLQAQFGIPDYMRFMMFFFGIMITMVGVFLIYGRAQKTGTIHLLEYGKAGLINWFYVYRDGTIKITPAFRDVEGMLYSKELDAEIHDMKSYRLFDHSVRFVPEALGHAADLDMCLYAHVLKRRWGFSNIITAREGAKFFQKKKQELVSPEYIARGEELDELRGESHRSQG